jgi:tRNA uridine 5-carboxymethylaminomethyl modification enzyme
MAKFLKNLGFKEKASKICKKYKKIESVIEEIKKSKSLKGKNLIEEIKQDKIKLSEIKNIKNTFNLDDVEIRSVLINMKYKTFIDREINNINKVRSNIDVKIPEDIDYSKVNNISNEATKSLKIKKPTTLRQASRIEGVGPADVFSLLCYIKNVSRET